MAVTATATVLLVGILLSMLVVLYTIAPTLTGGFILVILAVTVLVSVHTWYTRREVSESLSVFASPVTKTARILHRVSESIRRDPSPPTKKEDTLSTLEERYVTGDIATVDEFERELEKELGDTDTEPAETNLDISPTLSSSSRND